MDHRQPFHHALVLMSEDITVIDKGADVVHRAKTTAKAKTTLVRLDNKRCSFTES